LPGDSGELQPHAVDHASRTGMVENRMLWRHTVKLLPRGKARFLEACRKRVTKHDPFSIRDFPSLLENVRENVLQTLEIRQCLPQLARSRPNRMRVTVVKSGEDRLATGVNHHGSRSLEIQDCAVLPHRHDAIILDRYRLGNGELAVHRHDLGVMNYHVRG